MYNLIVSKGVDIETKLNKVLLNELNYVDKASVFDIKRRTNLDVNARLVTEGALNTKVPFYTSDDVCYYHHANDTLMYRGE